MGGPNGAYKGDFGTIKFLSHGSTLGSPQRPILLCSKLENSIFISSSLEWPQMTCIERILYCYDTLPLTDHMDPRLARFAVPEKTGDNVHHMVFQRDTDGNVCMQYKMYHYSNALYPRKYDVGAKEISQRFGEGVGQCIN